MASGGGTFHSLRRVARLHQKKGKEKKTTLQHKPAEKANRRGRCVCKQKNESRDPRLQLWILLC